MSKKSRKTYKKPQINHVKLVVDEAILAGCKIQAGSTTGPSPKKCGHRDCNTIFGS
jgi:hypothetical protein